MGNRQGRGGGLVLSRDMKRVASPSSRPACTIELSASVQHEQYGQDAHTCMQDVMLQDEQAACTTERSTTSTRLLCLDMPAVSAEPMVLFSSSFS